jgi:hypothetical protein
VQELERAGPVRAQHHVVIAEAVVELAHAGYCTDQQLLAMSTPMAARTDLSNCANSAYARESRGF